MLDLIGAASAHAPPLLDPRGHFPRQRRGRARRGARGGRVGAPAREIFSARGRQKEGGVVCTHEGPASISNSMTRERICVPKEPDGGGRTAGRGRALTREIASPPLLRRSPLTTAFLPPPIFSSHLPLHNHDQILFCPRSRRACRIRLLTLSDLLTSPCSCTGWRHPRPSPARHSPLSPLFSTCLCHHPLAQRLLPIRCPNDPLGLVGRLTEAGFRRTGRRGLLYPVAGSGG